MNTLDLALYIIEAALAAIKGKISGKKVETTEAFVRIVRAGYQGYQAELGQPLDEAKIRPFEPLV